MSDQVIGPLVLTSRLHILLPSIHPTVVIVSSVCHLVSIAHKTFFKRRLTSATQNSAILNKEVEFAWDEPQIAAFKKVKEVLTSSPGLILSYYDPTKDLTLQVDASQYCLGAVLLQNDKPVAYASKSLTTSEINYAQIEKEIYAIVFGCTRFHQYIYGRSIRVEMDHKLLVSIMKQEAVTTTANRIY